MTSREGNITQAEMMRELLAMQKESNTRDTRMETKIDYMSEHIEQQDKRMDKQDELLAKLSETLNDQKHLSHIVDTVVDGVNNHSKSIRELETSSIDNSRQIKSLDIKAQNYESRLTAIETKSGKIALAIWKKIAVVAGTGLVSGLIGYLLAYFLKK